MDERETRRRATVGRLLEAAMEPAEADSPAELERAGMRAATRIGWARARIAALKLAQARCDAA